MIRGLIPFFRSGGCAFLCALLAFPSTLLAPPPPAWWAERGATDPTKAADDSAAANIGQLKHFASKAYEELEAKLPGGAGPALTAMISPWFQPDTTGTRDDFAAVNLGQLKYVAKPFYDRLAEVGYPNTYPWTGSSTAAADHAVANLGQLKYVFRFDFDRASNNDGLTDAWKLANFGTIQVDPNADADHDGLSNAEEFAAGTDPNNSDTDGDTISDGDEAGYGGNPVMADTDGDGLTDGEELALGTPLNQAQPLPPGYAIIDLLASVPELNTPAFTTGINDSGEVAILTATNLIRWTKGAIEVLDQGPYAHVTVWTDLPAVFIGNSGTIAGTGAPTSSSTAKPAIWPRGRTSPVYLPEPPYDEDGPPPWSMTLAGNGDAIATTPAGQDIIYGSWPARCKDSYDRLRGGYKTFKWVPPAVGTLLPNQTEVHSETARITINDVNSNGDYVGKDASYNSVLSGNTLPFYPYALNDANEVVGWSNDDGNLVFWDGSVHEFTFPLNGAPLDINKADSNNQRTIVGANDLGGIVATQDPESGEFFSYNMTAWLRLRHTDTSNIPIILECTHINNSGMILASGTNADGTGYRPFLLLPVEIKATSHGLPPAGSAGKYNKSPSVGSVDNLISVWPTEELVLTVELPEPFKSNPPAGLITWTAPGHTVPDRTTEFTFTWLDTGIKNITINIGGTLFKVVVDVPDVGSITEADAYAALPPYQALSIYAHAGEAVIYTEAAGLGNVPRKDALRHSLWNALCASDSTISYDAIISVTTAHEYWNKWSTQDQAFNTSMDLHNNMAGRGTAHSILGLPNRPAILVDLARKYSDGVLWIWGGERPQYLSEGILSKSDRTKIFPQ